MNRRALLAAAAPAALLAACGEATTQPQEIPQRGTSETSEKGDRELLAFLEDVDRRHAEDDDARLAGYLDALPKLSDPDVRGEVFDRFLTIAAEQAEARDDAIGEAFVAGRAPA